MSKEAKIKMFVLCTSQYKQDKALNLDGVENFIKLFSSSANRIADIEMFSNLDSTVAKENLLSYFQNNNFSATELFVFYFCGHGFLVGDNLNTLLLATSDTTCSNSTAEVGIKFNWLLSEIKRNLKPQKSSKYIIILDCCHSAIAGNMGATWIDNVNLEDYSGAVIITSTETPTQCAREIDVNGIKHAAFTYYFSIALQNLLDSHSSFTLSDMIKKTTELIQHANPLYRIPLPKIKSVNSMEDMITINACTPKKTYL